MTTQITRRAALAGLGALALPSDKAFGQFFNPFAPIEDEAPVSGKAGPGLEPLDAGVLKIMRRHGIPGASLAIAKNGKLVLAKGYGWANLTQGTTVQPTTLFGLASLCKPFTAVAILKLVEEGKLGLDERVLDIVKIVKPAPGLMADPFLGDVTVRQCLNHTGGWDRTIEGDPIDWEPMICRALGVRPPISAAKFLSFIFGMPLDFKPGTEARYSNVGYIILGEVIARVSGQSYGRYVTENVLRPIGIKRAALHPIEGRYLENEAIRYVPGMMMPLPPMRLPMLDACGGWSASAVDMVRFVTSLDGSRGLPILKEKTRQEMLAAPPKELRRPDGTWFGLGWDSVMLDGNQLTLSKEGAFAGMRAFLKRQPSGVALALCFNANMDLDPIDVRITALAIRDVKQLVERIAKYPDIDLFKDFS